MTYEEAMEQVINNGKKIFRENNPDNYVVRTPMTVRISKDSLVAQLFVPTEDDMNATDWEIAEDSKDVDKEAKSV